MKYPEIINNESGDIFPDNFKQTGIHKAMAGSVEYYWKSPSFYGDKFYGWIKRPKEKGRVENDKQKKARISADGMACCYAELKRFLLTKKATLIHTIPYQEVLDKMKILENKYNLDFKNK